MPDGSLSTREWRTFNACGKLTAETQGIDMGKAQNKATKGDELRWVVGMTLDPAAAYRHWLMRVPGIEGWKVVETRPMRPMARGQKHRLSKAWGYEELPDEDGPLFAPWHVYVFAHKGSPDAGASLEIPRGAGNGGSRSRRKRRSTGTEQHPAGGRPRPGSRALSGAVARNARESGENLRTSAGRAKNGVPEDAELRWVVGMTRDPTETYQYWLRQIPGIEGWSVVDSHATRATALGKKRLIARAWQYDELPDEDGPLYATWHVYVFAHRDSRGAGSDLGLPAFPQ